MRRQFSKELDEDRDFEVGGEVFTFRYPPWEEMAGILDEDLEAVKSRNGDTEAGFTWKNDTETAIKRVNIFLDGAEQRKKWGVLVKRKENPVPRHQIVQLYRWLTEVTSGRPTIPPSDSDAGGGETDTSSPGESS